MASLGLIYIKNRHVATLIMMLALALILGTATDLFYRFYKASSKEVEYEEMYRVQSL